MTLEDLAWWRSADGVDHAFGVTRDWMRSRCRQVRWSVAMSPAEDPDRPCADCLAAIAHERELDPLPGLRRVERDQPDGLPCLSKEHLMSPRAARSVSSGRTYTIDGLTLWSVTTIIGNGLPKPAIAGWQARSIAEFAVANWRQIGGMLGAVRLHRTQDAGQFIVSDPDAIDGAIDWLKGAPWRESKRKMNVGSAVHAEAEAYALGIARPEPLPAVAPYLLSFRNFLDDFKPEFELVEATVFNVAEGYAGTLDAVARIGGRTFLFDWKTGKDIYPDVALQLAAYENAEKVLRNDGSSVDMPAVDGCAALHLTEFDPELAALDPSYRGYYVVPVATGPVAWDAFRFVREVMRWMEESSKDVLSQPLTNPAALVGLYPEMVDPAPKGPRKVAAA